MFQFIRRHQAIGLIFIGIVIISFVVFFSPNQPMGGGPAMPAGSLGSVYGQPVEPEEYRAALDEVLIGHLLREGNWPDIGGRRWNQDQEVLNRLFMQEEARRLGIKVTDEVAARWIAQLPIFKDETTGAFSRPAYDRLLEFLQRERGLTRTDFERFMRNEVAAQHLVQLGGLSGSLVPPREAEARYRAAHQQHTVLLVTFASSNYVDQVDLSDDSVARHYTNNLAGYRIPERRQVRYVRFELTNHIAEADAQLATNQNLGPVLDAEIARRGPQAMMDAQGQPLSPEAAREKLREEIRRPLLLSLARRQANAFANELYQLPPSVDSLNQLAETSGLEVRTSTPFPATMPPFELGVPATFARQAFSLEPSQPFATPFAGEQAVIVYALDRDLPSEIRPLELVRDSVIASLKRTESRNLAAAAGRQFATQAKAALAEGQSFAEAASTAGWGDQLITLAALGRTTPPPPEIEGKIQVSEIVRVADALRPGEVGDFTPTMDGGFVLFLQETTPPPAEELAREIPDFLKQTRNFGRFLSFTEWERQRMVAAEVRVPGGETTMENAPVAQ
jgi:hypothetical protein